MSQPHQNYTPSQLALIDRIDTTLTHLGYNFFGASEMCIAIAGWFLMIGAEMMRASGG